MRVQLAALIAAIGQVVAADLDLKVSGQEGVPPKFIFDGYHVSGICPDILHAISVLDPGLRFVGGYKPISVPLMEQGLESGLLDVACALTDIPRRHQIANMVPTPLYTVHERLAVRSSDPVDIKSFDDLAKASGMVVTFSGASYAIKLRELGVPVDDSNADAASTLRRLLSGHARFFYMNDLTLAYLIRNAHAQRDIRILPTQLHEESTFFWVSRKLPAETFDRLGRDIAALAANGELQRIYQRYELH